MTIGDAGGSGGSVVGFGIVAAVTTRMARWLMVPGAGVECVGVVGPAVAVVDGAAGGQGPWSRIAAVEDLAEVGCRIAGAEAGSGNGGRLPSPSLPS